MAPQCPFDCAFCRNWLIPSNFLDLFLAPWIINGTLCYYTWLIQAIPDFFQYPWLLGAIPGSLKLLCVGNQGLDYWRLVEMIGWIDQMIAGRGSLGPAGHQTDLTSTDGMFWAALLSMDPSAPSPSLLPMPPSFSFSYHVSSYWKRLFNTSRPGGRDKMTSDHLCLLLKTNLWFVGF